MHIILMFNLILYTWRLSILLGVHQQIGMMMIGASVDKTTRMQHRPVPLSPPSSSLPIFATCFVVPDGPVVAVV
jgi:hypothetical protein